MQKFDTPAPISAVLDIPAGRVQFIAADRAETVVAVLPADASKGRDVKAAEQTTVEYADGVLRIHTHAARNQYFGPTGSLEVTVRLPAGSRVEAKAASCEFRGVGRLGDVAFEGAYRQIKIDEAASVRLTAVDGDVDHELTTSRGRRNVNQPPQQARDGLARSDRTRPDRHARRGRPQRFKLRRRERRWASHMLGHVPMKTSVHGIGFRAIEPGIGRS